MIRRDAKKGLASLCIGGGMGVALAIERVKTTAARPGPGHLRFLVII
jgi:hypothetical protein